MANRLPVALNYASHLPALMQALARTHGRVLELGMGLFSTPYLHYACQLAGRELVSYENDAGWAEFFGGEHGYASGLHTIRVVSDWDNAHINRKWDVALIDHSPSERRIVDIERLAKRARYVIAHDSDHHWRGEMHYQRIYPLFKHRTTWDNSTRQTVVLSNFEPLEDFWRPL